MSPLYIPPTPVYRPPSASGGAGLTAGSITREHIADPAGVPSARLAADFDTDRGYLTTAWQPTTTSFSIGATIVHWRGNGDGSIIGATATNTANIVARTGGELRLRSGGGVLATSTITVPEGSPTAISADITTDSVTFYIGAESETLAIATTAWLTGGTTTWFIGTGSDNKDYVGSIWDVWATDDDATKSFEFPLDGTLVNTLAGSTVADATAVDWVPWSHINTAATGTYGAKFPYNVTTEYLSLPAIADTSELTVSFKIQVYQASAFASSIVYGGGVGKWGIQLSADGSVHCIHNTGQVAASSAAGALLPTGATRTLSFHVTDADAAQITLDGVEVASGSHAHAIAANAVDRIGAGGALETVNCAIWDFTYTDHDNAANNLAYSLNNTLAETNGGTALTETGTVPFEVVIGSPPPKPVPAVRPAVTEVTKAAVHTYATTVSFNVVHDAAAQDDFGRANGTRVDVSDGSLIEATWSGTVELDILGTKGDAYLEFRDLGGDGHGLPHSFELTASGEVMEITFTRKWYQVGDDTVGVALFNAASPYDDTWKITNASLTVIEYPNTP